MEDSGGERLVLRCEKKLLHLWQRHLSLPLVGVAKRSIPDQHPHGGTTYQHGFGSLVGPAFVA